MPSMFKVPRSEFSSKFRPQRRCRGSPLPGGSQGRLAAQSLLTMSTRPLNGTGQKLYALSIGFEQGILVSLTIIGLPVLAGLACGVVYTGKYVHGLYFG